MNDGRIEDRAVDVRLGREVHDRVELASAVGHGVRVADVALDDEPIVRIGEIRAVAGVGEQVEHDDTSSRAASKRTKFEPMKPAPPVTRTRIGAA